MLTTAHPEFAAVRPRFPDLPGVRSIIRVRVTRIADSCGYGVPRFTYQATRNRISLDGLPGLPPDDD